MDVILGIVAYSVVLGFIAGALFWLLRERGPPDGGDDGGGRVDGMVFNRINRKRRHGKPG